MHQAIAERRRSVQEQQWRDLVTLCETTQGALASLSDSFDAPAVARLKQLLLDFEDLLRPGVDPAALDRARGLVAQMAEPVLYLVGQMRNELSTYLARESCCAG